MILYYTHKVPSNGTKQFICKKLVQYLYLSKTKTKNQYLLKKKNVIYYFIAFNLCLDVSRKREKGEKKKKKRQGNKQVQIKLRVGAEIDEGN